MLLSQNDAGRAFEYGIAYTLSRYLPAAIRADAQLQKAVRCFQAADATEQRHILNAARAAVLFLAAHDDRLSDTGCSVYVQSDQMGQQGDVRDVIVHNNKLKTESGR
jgi:hypothetical protein